MSKRTEANNRSDRNYRARRKIVRIAFHEVNDAELLAQLRSQVSTDADLPKYLKGLIETAIANNQTS